MEPPVSAPYPAVGVRRWAVLSDDILRLLTVSHWLTAYFLATQPSLIPWVVPWSALFALAGFACLVASFRRSSRTIALAGALTIAAYASRAMAVVVSIAYLGTTTPGAYVGITAWSTMSLYAWRLFRHAHKER